MQVPYETLCYVVGAVNYGGRVTDYMDQVHISIILSSTHSVLHMYSDDMKCVNFGFLIKRAIPLQRCVAAILSTYFCPAAVEDPKYAYSEDGLYAPPAPGPLQATRE